MIAIAYRDLSIAYVRRFRVHSTHGELIGAYIKDINSMSVQDVYKSRPVIEIDMEVLLRYQSGERYRDFSYRARGYLPLTDEKKTGEGFI